MSDSRIQPLNRACVSPSPPLEERVGQGCGQSRSAGFQTCCIAGLPACGRAEISDASSLATHCRLEIGDTAGLETCATLELADFVNPCPALDQVTFHLPFWPRFHTVWMHLLPGMIPERETIQF